MMNHSSFWCGNECCLIFTCCSGSLITASAAAFTSLPDWALLLQSLFKSLNVLTAYSAWHTWNTKVSDLVASWIPWILFDNGYSWIHNIIWMDWTLVLSEKLLVWIPVVDQQVHIYVLYVAVILYNLILSLCCLNRSTQYAVAKTAFLNISTGQGHLEDCRDTQWFEFCFSAECPSVNLEECVYDPVLASGPPAHVYFSKTSYPTIQALFVY